MYYAGLVWVIALLCLCVWAVNASMHNHFPVRWPLRMLRSMATLSSSVLYMPLATILFSGLSCKSECESGARARARVQGSTAHGAR